MIYSIAERPDFLCSPSCTLKAVPSSLYSSHSCSPWTFGLETYSWSLRNCHGSSPPWKVRWGWHSVGHSGCPANGHSHGCWKINRSGKTKEGKVRMYNCEIVRNPTRTLAQTQAKDTLWCQPVASSHGVGARSHKSSWWRWLPAPHSAIGSAALKRGVWKGEKHKGRRHWGFSYLHLTPDTNLLCLWLSNRDPKRVCCRPGIPSRKAKVSVPWFLTRTLISPWIFPVGPFFIPVKPPSAMLNMKRCLIFFFCFSSFRSLGVSPFWSITSFFSSSSFFSSTEQAEEKCQL